MKPFTVVLRRSDELQQALGLRGPEKACDSYTALVEAEDVYAAQDVAVLQLCAAEAEEAAPDDSPPNPADYAVLVVFEGYQDPKLFGWQTTALHARKMI